MRDVIEELKAVHRHTGERVIGDREVKTVTLRRAYDAPIEDVWEAITAPDRIARWFLPVSGDLRLGGTYQIEGNAGGEITGCEPPRRLAVTWFMGERPEGAISDVEVRLSPGQDGTTTFELRHEATVPPDQWPTFGPGAVGVGWDGALLGLAMYVADTLPADPAAWMESAEAKGFYLASSQAWGDALAATGADPESVATAVRNTTAFYVPDA